MIDGAFYITPLDMIYNDGKFWNENSALYVTDYPRFFDIERVFEKLVWVDDEEGESYQVCEGCVLPEDIVYDEGGVEI